jgi:signal transduction histidine kinase
MAQHVPRVPVHAGRDRGYAHRVSSALRLNPPNIGSRLRAWLRQPSARTLDVALTVAAGVPVVGTTVASGAEQDRVLLGLLFGLAATLPLLVRRRWPFAVLAVTLAVATATPVNGQYVFPIMVALYTIGSTRSWEATIAAAAAIVATGFVYILAGGPEFTYNDLLAVGLTCAVTAGLGLFVQSRRDSLDALRERAERLTRERELLAERAVAEERVRIAQELHDVVAHNVSLIVVQAQALGATVRDDRVAGATAAIADLGREAMAEMHRTLKLLRAAEDHAAERAPQPGLGDLDDLLERARAAGLRVDLAVEGDPRPLAQSVDLSAFRILQEALTNVVKHAGRAHTTVLVGYRADALELTVTDAGDGTPEQAPTLGGHGLVGMRERAALFGGSLTAGPSGDRGFEVHAILPYGEARGA